jgi:anaerobic magnesium-protoporphyrin IX monomethyl ester cyclase
LKVLKGVAMRRIAAEEGYAYAATPPYKILRTPWLSFEEIGRIEDISRLLDQIANSGRFSVFLRAVAREMPLSSFFAQLARFNDETEAAEPKSIPDLCDLIHRFLVATRGELLLLLDALSFDYCRTEYPTTTRLPACFGVNAGFREARGPAVSHSEKIPAGARVRRFRRQFLRNYLEKEWQEEPTEVLFIYVAQRGEGERVEMEKITAVRQA